jgi:lauroyl/myristoyl acyltransferase
MHIDSLRETSLQLVLMLLTRHRTTFDPLVHIAGAEHLPPAGAGPLLFISPHTMLSLLVPRVLRDRGYEPLVLISAFPIRFYGTTTDGNTLVPSPEMFFEVRRAFRNGETVMSMVDRGDPERRNALFRTVKGPFRVSDALIRLALRSGARIVFFAVKTDAASRVVLHLGAPSNEGVSGVVSDFVKFVDDTLRGGTAPRAFSSASPTTAATAT